MANAEANKKVRGDSNDERRGMEAEETHNHDRGGAKEKQPTKSRHETNSNHQPKPGVYAVMTPNQDQRCVQ